MITTRDMETIDFVSRYKAASTSTIAEIMFPSISAAQKRLKIIHSENKISRIRDNINNDYVYFIKQPKQLRHSILVTDFYRELHKCCDVASFRPEPALGDIRPDAVFGYRLGGRGYIGLLEVEISNKGFDIQKYKKFFVDEYKRFFPSPPVLFIVSDTVKPFEATFRFKIVHTDFTNLKALL